MIIDILSIISQSGTIQFLINVEKIVISSGHRPIHCIDSLWGFWAWKTGQISCSKLEQMASDASP